MQKKITPESKVLRIGLNIGCSGFLYKFDVTKDFDTEEDL